MSEPCELGSLTNVELELEVVSPPARALQEDSGSVIDCS